MGLVPFFVLFLYAVGFAFTCNVDVYNSRMDFSIALRKNMANGNIVYSPYSISTALAMAMAGAGGETKKQMHEKIFGGVNESDLIIAFEEETNDLKLPKKFTLQLVNRVYVEKSYPLIPTFVEKINGIYGGEFLSADFINEADAETVKINAFVADKTNGKIENLIAKGQITEDTGAVLINAIYFNAAWKEAFPELFSKEANFHSAKSGLTKVTMMEQTNYFAYAADGDFEMLRLPYKGSNEEAQIAMQIYLPRNISLDETALTREKLIKLTSSAKRKEVQVFLPKFKVESSFELSDSLKKIGVSLAFDDKLADFYGMLVAPDVVYIDKVIHKAFISVAENGTEAAAATAVIMSILVSLDMEVEEEKPIVFKADHPFAFEIVYKNNVLFSGRYTGSE